MEDFFFDLVQKFTDLEDAPTNSATLLRPQPKRISPKRISPKRISPKRISPWRFGDGHGSRELLLSKTGGVQAASRHALRVAGVSSHLHDGGDEREPRAPFLSFSTVL